MTEPLIPPQLPGPDAADDLRDGRPPVEPEKSEAGRLLCSGTYLDADYRDSVIDELFVHEERIAAPSYGFDATRVLAHALRARRVELGWAAGVLGAWFVASVLTGGVLALLIVPFLLLGFARWLRRKWGANPLVRFATLAVRIYAWWVVVLLVLLFWKLATGTLEELGEGLGTFLSSVLPDQVTGGSGRGSGSGAYPYPGYPDSSGSSGSSWSSSGSDEDNPPWWVLPLFVGAFAGVVAVVGGRRWHTTRIIARDLEPTRYAADRAEDPAEKLQSVRLDRIRERVRGEQHSPLIMYNINSPFTGAGDPYRPWHLSVELRPREDLGPDRKPRPLTNADIVRRVVPLLEALRVPSPHGSPEAEAAVQDRLRELVVDECVFLPAGGLPHRDLAPLSAERYEEQRAGAIEEGGERRRHFLRVRVGGWEENLVVTVFVRVHTQGRMMMLEVAPHLLLPVRVDFHNADADAQRYRNNNWLGTAAEALVATTSSIGSSLLTLGRGVNSWWRIAIGGHGGARPEGPGLSVRELAAEDNGSLFHLMDIDRYLKTIQDRVVGGVTVALHEAGWHTEEFAQRAVTVAEGGVFIQSVNGSAFSVGGTGHHNTVGDGGTGSKGSKGGK
ncbi:hypothetical protein [Streptomyces sp. RerS4]|uniref:hypothetical protein n=1 Tax=Streptomyces sp. RerS4 TaxID=2942449 RepID=UPI00201BC415|nr:hypothetical protein [Streptomyces sp. RerS4]UQX02625.1 hypothetical protein M4D82_20595 [Streptomyces sp. RerS4]